MILFFFPSKQSFEFYTSKELEDDEMENIDHHPTPEIIGVESYAKNNEMKITNEEYDESNLIYR